ncbi:hypothetical protein GCM10009662_83660 [Catellatospora coxensis]|uniref:Secreted protein n=1 Tax=Catellatospora coxensis TaxID=310354 RepID=A0A8J3L3P2_9ACTN|nr:hypothetical protein Cco03nite_75440 [Catellatospora coxensis]
MRSSRAIINCVHATSVLIAPASATAGGLTAGPPVGAAAGTAPPHPASSKTTAHPYTRVLIADLPLPTAILRELLPFCPFGVCRPHSPRKIVA